MNKSIFNVFHIFGANAKVAFTVIFFSGFAQSIAQTSTTDILTADKINEFLKEEIVFTRYLFTPGQFPLFGWKNERKVVQLVGEVKLHAKFFDDEMNEVRAAQNVGRYGAVIEGIVRGYTIRRYVTLFCIDGEIKDWIESSNVALQDPKKFHITPRIRNDYQFLGKLFSIVLKDNLDQDPRSAIYLAGLSEQRSKYLSNVPFDPRFIDRQWWLEFKLKYNPTEILHLAYSKKTHQNTAIELHQSKTNVSEYTQNDIRMINSVCTDWLRNTNQAFSLLIAHQGKIIYHRAFGTTDSGDLLTLETPRWMASITKLLTGILMMHFVDSGIVSLDDPVKKYLPEFSTSTSGGITIRQLFTHTSGLVWDEDWTSEYNEALENMTGQLIPYVTPGKQFKYNRIGYALAGKIMERISGKAIPYLFYEKLIRPLNLKHTTIENTYGATYSTSYDIAVIAQLLLNKGSYKGYNIFSSKALFEMLPTKLRDRGVDSAREWGIGTRWFKEIALSDSTFGHSAASGAMVRIDPKNQLIIVCSRNAMGSDEKAFEKFAGTLIRAAATPINRSK